MMFKNNFRMALSSLRASRWRSFLTMLGVIIGVVAVVTVISIGEGIKRSITAETEALGPNVITVMPGNQIDRRDEAGIIFNPLASVGFSLTETDVTEIREIEGAYDVVPFVRVPGTPEADDVSMSGATILAVTGDVPRILSQEVRFGTWHAEEPAANREFAVIGSEVAEELFGELAPIGRSMSIGDRTFTVRGIFAEFPRSPLPFMSTDYNRSIFIEYENNALSSSTGRNIFQILVNPSDATRADDLAEDIDQTLLASRDNARDFTVLKRAEMVNVYGEVLDVITIAISAIAAISLFVGGVGIMNIMFVSVSERTGEIGIRKAIGATNGQIMSQFITEAIVLSLLGGIFGILGSLLVNYFIRLFTILEPVIIPEVVVFASLLAFVIGVVFGAIPAIRAARKDPIDALRYRI